MKVGYLALTIFLIQKRGYLPLPLRNRGTVDVQAEVDARLKELEEQFRGWGKFTPPSSQRLMRDCGIPATIYGMPLTRET